MNERDAFLKSLTENEDDTLTRLVYADWLDERGEHEEADRQRKWPGAKRWLVQLCDLHNFQSEDEDPYERVIPYRELVELGRTAVKEAVESDGPSDWRGVVDCGNNMDMCDALRDNHHEFWANWSIVTGVPVPSDVEENLHFTCAC